MTMGIVLVACLAARIAGVVARTSTSTLSCTSSATSPGMRSRFALSVAILNLDVFPLDVTEIAQPLAECLDIRCGSVGSTRGCQISDPRDFLWVLRVSEGNRSQQDSCEYPDRNFPFHDFPLNGESQISPIRLTPYRSRLTELSDSPAPKFRAGLSGRFAWRLSD